MTTYANRPGYGLYETQVRDKRTGRVTTERRWMKDRVALNLNADPVTPASWDSTGWLPDGRHRRTGTPLNPDGVPVEYDRDVRRGDADAMTDADLAEAYRSGTPAAEARAHVERQAAHLRADADYVAALRMRPSGGPSAAMGGIPLSVARERDDGTTLKEVPVIRDGRIHMENRRVAYTNRDAAQRTRGDVERASRWGRSDRPVTAADLAQPEDPREVRLPYQWAETRKVVKRMGGKWSAMSKTWRMPDESKAAELRRFLEDRATREGVI